MLLGGALSPATSLPRGLYARVLRPRGLVRPRVRIEDPAPHRFAQLVGGTFLVAASVSAVLGQLTVAWTLGWIVIALAFLNFAFDICVGCIVYAQLVRVGRLPADRPPRSRRLTMAPVLIAPLAALVVLGLVAGALAVQRSWQRRLVGSAVRGTPVGVAGATRSDILYFTGAGCTVCHVAQRPALDRLRVLLPDVQVREIDVAREPALARSYRVMTLPTTVVLDATGRTAALNTGYASEVVLREQVEAARLSSLAGALA